MNKLHQELRLLVSHDIKDGEWELDLLMRVTEREIDVRERLNTNPMQPPRKQRELSIMATLLSNDQTYSYCNQLHPVSACKSVTDIEARKLVLRNTGRCYVCLRRHHLSRDCQLSAPIFRTFSTSSSNDLSTTVPATNYLCNREVQSSSRTTDKQILYVIINNYIELNVFYRTGESPPVMLCIEDSVLP